MAAAPYPPVREVALVAMDAEPDLRALITARQAEPEVQVSDLDQQFQAALEKLEEPTTAERVARRSAQYMRVEATDQAACTPAAGAGRGLVRCCWSRTLKAAPARTRRPRTTGRSRRWLSARIVRSWSDTPCRVLGCRCQHVRAGHAHVGIRGVHRRRAARQDLHNVPTADQGTTLRAAFWSSPARTRWSRSPIRLMCSDAYGEPTQG